MILETKLINLANIVPWQGTKWAFFIALLCFTAAFNIKITNTVYTGLDGISVTSSYQDDVSFLGKNIPSWYFNPAEQQ